MRRRSSLRARLVGAFPYAVLLVGAAYLYIDAGSVAALARSGELGPQFWPRLVLGVLMLVCAGAIARALLVTSGSRTASSGPQRHGAGQEPEYADDAPQAHPYRLLGGVALCAAYVAGMGSLGFFLATTLFLALFMWLGRYRRPGVIVAASLIGSLAFVFVFMKIVYVSLPLGVAPFQAISLAVLRLLGIR